MKKITLCLFLSLFSLEAAVCNDQKDNESGKTSHPSQLYYCNGHQFSTFELSELWFTHHLRIKYVTGEREARKAVLKYGTVARYGEIYLITFTDTLSNPVPLEKVLKMQEGAK